MSGPLTDWHDEHVRFGRLLNLLEEQVNAFRAGEEPNYDLMREIVHYLQNFAHRYHHVREDVAFDRLAEREPSMRMIANRLLQEHRVIAWAGEELADRLMQITEDVIVERAAVEAAASTYLVYYRHHLVAEERDILPRAAHLLTPDDWAAVAAAVPPEVDPLFGPDFDVYYEQLRRQLRPAA